MLPPNLSEGQQNYIREMCETAINIASSMPPNLIKKYGLTKQEDQMAFTYSMSSLACTFMAKFLSNVHPKDRPKATKELVKQVLDNLHRYEKNLE